VPLTHRPGFDFAFDARACSDCGGRCCRWGGTVRVGSRALRMLATHLGLAPAELVDRYLVKRGYGYSLRVVSTEAGPACILYDGGCSAYEARPPQCREFPFWEELREDRGAWGDCPGIVPRPQARPAQADEVRGRREARAPPA